MLRELRLKRLVTSKDIGKCDQILVEQHYLHSAQLVGEQLRYAVIWKGQWLAVAAWSAAALHRKARDQFIGWSEEQRRRRLALVVNNSRLHVLPQCHYPNLVSRFMKLMLGRLSQDWESTWGHPVVLAESFVDPQEYRGTAYKVSGWSPLGPTSGWKRSAVDCCEKHDRPKQVWVRELVKNACGKLCAPALPPQWAKVEENAVPRCIAKAPQIRSLVETLRAQVPECRSKHALAYPIAGMLALLAMAMFSSVRRGPQDLAEYAATLPQGQSRALGFRPSRHTGRTRCPGITPFRDVLLGVDATAVERALLLWQEQLDARGWLKLKRGYWVIQSRLHHALDVSLDEDRSRVRQPNAALVLGLFRRLVVSVAQTAIAEAQTKKTRWTVRPYQQRFAHRDGGPQRLQALIFAQTPCSWHLPS